MNVLRRGFAITAWAVLIATTTAPTVVAAAPLSPNPCVIGGCVLGPQPWIFQPTTIGPDAFTVAQRGVDAATFSIASGGRRAVVRFIASGNRQSVALVVNSLDPANRLVPPAGNCPPTCSANAKTLIFQPTTIAPYRIVLSRLSANAMLVTISAHSRSLVIAFMAVGGRQQARIRVNTLSRP